MKNIILVGNPNCGKSTFFNSFTGAKEHIGNWHGVTTLCKERKVERNGKVYSVVDTPGIYSLSAFSFEEEESIKYLNSHKRDKIINICDRDNIQKNLYLSLCLMEEGFDVSLLINCTKKKAKRVIDATKLSNELGIKVCLVNASKKNETKNLEECFFEKKGSVIPKYFDENFKNKSEIDKAKIRYEYIDALLEKTSKKVRENGEKIDRILLNKFLALPIFFVLMLGIFYLTFFTLGSRLSNLLNSFFEIFSHPVLDFLAKNVGKGFLFNLFETAIFGGVSTILSFLPQVVLLFFFLNIFEESGYLSRVAFLFDDLLSKIGLSGKSVYTILMSFGCSTSAIMTSKISDSENAKTKAAIVCPYQSCSAKIPIYLVLGTAFFGRANVFVIFLMYLLGLVVSLVVCGFLDKHFLKNTEQTFVIEFPEYRLVSFKKTLYFLYKNTKEFLKKIASILICVNVVLFVLSSFSFSFQYVGVASDKSILNTIASLIAPIFLPLGFGRSGAVSVLLGGFVAKEVIVSLIALFNGVSSGLSSEISNSILNPSNPIYFGSIASAVSFLSFAVLYVPCLSSVLMLRSEVGKKWTLIAVLIQFFVAYIVSLFLYNDIFAVEIFGFWKVIIFVFAIAVVFSCVYVILKKFAKKQKGCVSCNGDCGGDCDKNF